MLGTSNSLLRTGWVEGLKTSLPDAEIDNLSIGASPGLQFAARLDMDFRQYDFVLFDSLPNDEEYYRWNLSSDPIRVEAYKKSIESIITLISEQTTLIVVLIPLREFFFDKSPIYEHRVAFAKKHDLSVIDCSVIIQDILERHQISFEGIYKYHPAHPEVSIMNLIGRTLAQIFSQSVIEAEKRSIASANAFSKLVPNNYDSTHHFKNSIIDEVFFIYGKNARVKLDSSKTLLGFYANIAQSNCLLRFFDEENHEIYSISMYYDESADKNRVVKVFIPLPLPINPEAMIISAPEPEDASYLAMGSSPRPTEQKNVSLAASDIILIGADTGATRSRRPKAIPELTRTIISRISALKGDSFFITPRHGCDSAPLTLSYLENEVKTPNKKLALITHAETFIAFNLRDWSLCHHRIADIGASPDLQLVVVKFLSKDTISLQVPLGSSTIDISPFEDQSAPISLEFFGSEAALGRNGLYVCADGGHGILADRDEVSGWEKFSLSYVL
ncbi:hypothetical protein HW537_03680 [Asaia siamensis]